MNNLNNEKNNGTSIKRMMLYFAILLGILGVIVAVFRVLIPNIEAVSDMKIFTTLLIEVVGGALLFMLMIKLLNKSGLK